MLQYQGTGEKDGSHSPFCQGTGCRHLLADWCKCYLCRSCAHLNRGFLTNKKRNVHIWTWFSEVANEEQTGKSAQAFYKKNYWIISKGCKYRYNRMTNISLRVSCKDFIINHHLYTCVFLFNGRVSEGCILVLAWKGVRRVANFLLQFFVPFFLTLFLINSLII